MSGQDGASIDSAIDDMYEHEALCAAMGADYYATDRRATDEETRRPAPSWTPTFRRSHEHLPHSARR
jgi:hypothetical protein